MPGYNLDPAALNARIAKLERTVAFLLDKLELEYEDITESEFPDVLALKLKGDLIGAIKLYREKTGVSLPDAKKYVESMEI